MASVTQPRTRPLLRGLAITLAVLAILVLYRAVLREGPAGDFLNHRVFASRFLAGTPLYDGYLDAPYPQLWAMAYVPLALLPEGPAFLISTTLAVAALAVLLTMLLDQLRRAGLSGGIPDLALVALLLIAARPFVLRDLLDGGPNLLVFTLAWSGVYLWSRERPVVGGICLGLAAALKCTPALFLLYFAWKRQWRMAIATLVAGLGFTLLPMLVQGPEAYLDYMATWADHVLGGFHAEPGWCILGPEELRNCSLRPSLARLIVDLPPGHPGRLEHPARIQLAHLSPTAAQFVLRGVLFGLVALLAWSCRRPLICRKDGRALGECAAVALAMLLLSPITWGQHCVAVIPALALLSRRAAMGEDAWLKTGLALVVVLFVLGLNRGLTGPMGAGVLAHYGALPLSLLLMIVLCLRDAPRPGSTLRDVAVE